jgi:hypothetical protein
MIKKIAFLLLFGSLSIAATAQTRVRLNMLEKSPLSNMIVVTKNDSTARYTKLVAGTGVTIAYNEADTTLTLSATASAGNTDEQTLTFDPATGDLSISNGNTVNLTEGIQDAVASMLVAGTNVTLTYNDVAGTLTIAASGTGGGASDLGSLTDVDTTGKADGYVLAYNSATSTWEAQANSIDNLTDGYKFNGNIVLGRPFVRKPTGVDYGNIFIGVAAGPDSLLGYANIAIGQDVFRSFIADPISQGNANIAIGEQAMNKTLTGFQNVAIGRQALKGNLTGDENLALGRGAGYNNFGDPDNILTNYNQGVYIGTHATPRDTFSTNELVFGYNAVGNGSNTATFGNNSITATYLKGTTNLRGYGAGNKEAADLTKTRSAYIAAFATDGTLLELDTTGLFGGGGSGTPQTLSFSESTRELAISDGNTVDLSEGIQEEMNSTLVAGTGITITYDDGAGTLTVAAPAGSGNTDEQTLSLDNATAVLSISNGNSVDLSESIDNQVNTLTVAGTNIAKAYDDGANTLTLSTTDALTAIDAITFDANTTTEVANRLQFNTDHNTLTFAMANATPIRIGQDLGWYVKNQTGTTIAKGVAVMAVGTVGASGRVLIDELVADGSIDAHYFLGVTAESIANGADGFVTSQGHIRGINTSAFPDGTVLYASPTTPGAFTATEPTGNDLKLPLAFVINSAANGEITVRADPGGSIKDLHDVDVTGIASNSILKYNNASQVWEIGTDNSESTTASNGLTLSGVDVKLGGTLTEATTITMAGNDMTFTGTTGSDVLIDLAGNTTINSTNASGYNSSLILDGVGPRLLADAKTTEPLNMIELMGGRAGTKEMILSSQVSNDNTTYTAMYFNPLRVSLKTPNVVDLTAQNGQFLQLVDRLTGEIEFASALSAEVDGSVTNEGSLTVTAGTGTTSVINSNTSGSVAVTLEASTGLSIGESGNTITLTNAAPDQTVSLTGGGITAISGTYPSFTITSTEVDGSVTNEGALSIGTGVAGSSVFIQSNTSTSTPVTISVGAGFDIAASGSTIFLNPEPFAIETGTSGAISWGSLPQRIHVLDFGANTSITLSFTNVAVGGIYTLRVTGNSGTDTLVWPGAAKFEDGTSAGTVTLQDGGQMFTFYWDGTNYWVK